MSLTFDELRQKNVARCQSPTGFNHKLEAWSTSDWMVALVGEVGEASNIIKKLNRIRDGVALKKELPSEMLRVELRKELADAQIYLDLLTASLGFNLGEITQHKFNITSVDIGSEIRL